MNIFSVYEISFSKGFLSCLFFQTLGLFLVELLSNIVTTEFFIFVFARLTRNRNLSTDLETSLKVTMDWKFSKETRQKQKFFTDSEKVGNFLKTSFCSCLLWAKVSSFNISHFNRPFNLILFLIKTCGRKAYLSDVVLS